MNTKIFFYIIIVSLFCISCSKETEVVQDNNSTFKFSETFMAFTEDSLSSSEIKISSDNENLIKHIKNSLVMATNFSENDGFHMPYNNKNFEFDDTVKSNIEVIIEILSINHSNKESIGFSISNYESNLKSTLPWLYSATFAFNRRTCIENGYKSLYVVYHYVSNDNNGIIVEMGHLNCWLCPWLYPINERFYLFGQESNNDSINNDWFDIDGVYKISTRITTNLSSHENYSVVLSII